MFHTVYLSFEGGNVGRDYIGKHSSENPYDDYLGSFKDKFFDPSGKIILEYAKTEEGAIEAEVRWQKVFKVVEDPRFSNLSYQNTSKFRLSYCGEESIKKREQSLRDYYSTGEGFKAQGDKTRGKVWYHMPDGTEKRFNEDPGSPWIEGRNEKLGNIVKHNLNPSAGGQVSGKLPWWTNGNETARASECPGEGWVRGRNWESPKSKPIVVVNLETGQEYLFKSATEAASYLGVSREGLSRVARGERNSHKGYKATYLG